MSIHSRSDDYTAFYGVPPNDVPLALRGPISVRKRPVVVEAIQWTGTNWDAVHEFAGGYVQAGPPGFDELRIQTLEGPLFAKRGDFIIRGVKGEFYPCKPDIFEQTYELVR